LQVVVEVVNVADGADENSNMIVIEIEMGTSLAQLGVRLGLTEQMAQMAWVNGEVKTGEYTFKEGDTVVYYSSLDSESEEVQMSSKNDLQET